MKNPVFIPLVPVK